VTKKNGDDILTPLHCAAINPNPRILESLLNIAPEYSILDSRMRRPIHYAAACETSGPVEFLISKGVDVREGDNLKT
jgi:ankyrin repeat protein